MPNHFQGPPFNLGPAAAEMALSAAIETFLANCRRDGIAATEDQAREILTSGDDWWSSVEIGRAWVAARRRPADG